MPAAINSSRIVSDLLLALDSVPFLMTTLRSIRPEK
jgi:hypothetical protein